MDRKNKTECKKRTGGKSKMKGKKEIITHIEELERMVLRMDCKQDDRFTLIGGLAVIKSLVKKAK